MKPKRGFAPRTWGSRGGRRLRRRKRHRPPAKSTPPRAAKPPQPRFLGPARCEKDDFPSVLAPEILSNTNFEAENGQFSEANPHKSLDHSLNLGFGLKKKSSVSMPDSSSSGGPLERSRLHFFASIFRISSWFSIVFNDFSIVFKAFWGEKRHRPQIGQAAARLQPQKTFKKKKRLYIYIYIFAIHYHTMSYIILYMLIYYIW